MKKPIIKFEKVSYEEFVASCGDYIKEYEISGRSLPDLRTVYDNIKLPTRGTKGSAGYDLYSPFGFDLPAGENNTKTFCLGIRAIMPKNTFLAIVPRSGVGFKTGARLANTVGIIDSDYADSDNEGHIKAKLVGGFKDLSVKAGDRVLQGIFLRYNTTIDDCASTSRNGGFGSTGSK